MPVVSLEVTKRNSPQYGVIKGPRFEVQGWASEEDVRAGRKSKAAAKPAEKPEPKQPTKAEMEAELDDEIPNWGSKKKRGAAKCIPSLTSCTAGCAMQGCSSMCLRLWPKPSSSRTAGFAARAPPVSGLRLRRLNLP